MATISSTGIGSGLDVNNIVTQLVAVEKQPLKVLEARAEVVQTKISAMAQISSQFAALGDAASAIASASAWTARTASSSNTSAASITVDATAAATSFTLDVDVVAKEQSIASATVPKNGAVGAGVLRIQFGTWSDLSSAKLAASQAADSLAAPYVAAKSAADAWRSANTAATDALTANQKASTQLTALKSNVPPIAAEVSTYVDRYSAWVAAVGANDHVDPLKQSAEATALSDLTAAYTALGATDKAAVLNVANKAAAADALATYATSHNSVQAYSTAYTSWMQSVAANYNDTDPTLQANQATALATLNTAYNALSTADKTAVNSVTAVGVTRDASALKGTAVTAATTLSTALTTAGITPTGTPLGDANAADTAYNDPAGKVALANAARPTFTGASSTFYEFTISASDTVASVAASINKVNIGVTATAFFDGTQDRLLLRSKNTGEANGFKLTASTAGGTPITDGTGLSRLAFDPSSGAFGAASAGSVIQAGNDAKARINGMAVTSSSNTLAGAIPGATITLLAPTTASVTMAIKEDVTVAVKNVDNFVKAYNELVTNLTDLTKYDPTTKTAGAFQGDAAVVGLLSVLRNMSAAVSKSGSTYNYLSDVGIVGVKNQLNGLLSVNTSKLSLAANNGAELRRLFVPDDPVSGPKDTTNGFANMFANLAKGVLASGGLVSNKASALQRDAQRNTTEQTKVNDRAAASEARLRRQYSALDGKMASLSALNAYVSQQVAAWNKSSS